MGTVQEARAEKALSALKSLSPTQVRVIREGQEKLIPRGELTIGDLLVLREGDLVGADAQLRL
jgi:Ca2+-transporting ATPase